MKGSCANDFFYRLDSNAADMSTLSTLINSCCAAYMRWQAAAFHLGSILRR